jgi:hypothetical protein
MKALVGPWASSSVRLFAGDRAKVWHREAYETVTYLVDASGVGRPVSVGIVARDETRRRPKVLVDEEDRWSSDE